MRLWKATLTVIALTVASGCLAAQTGASQGRADTETWTFAAALRGDETENYSLTDVGSDTSRPGCYISEEGATTVDWKNVWHFDAVVRNGEVVKVNNLKHIAGPARPDGVSYSNVKGQNTESDPTHGSCGKSTGKYDCTSKPLTPAYYGKPNPHGTVENQGGHADITFLAYDHLKANYRGAAPSGYPCGSAIGSNLLPGGVLAGQFSGNFKIRALYATLSAYKVGKFTTSEAGSKSGGWLDPVYRRGADCWTSSQRNSGDKCTVGDSARSMHLYYERLK